MAMENAPTVVFTFVCSPPPPAAVLLGNGPGGGVGNGTPGGFGGGGVAGVVYTGFAEVSMLVLRVGSFVGRYTIVVLETLRKSPFRGRFARLFRGLLQLPCKVSLAVEVADRKVTGTVTAPYRFARVEILKLVSELPVC